MFCIPNSGQIRQSKKAAKFRKVNYLLAVDQDPKTAKSNRLGAGYLTAIQYLAPARVSGYQVCSSASEGCASACLHTAGIPFILQNKNRARIARTRFFMEARSDYFNCLFAEIEGFRMRCHRLGFKPRNPVEWHVRYPMGNGCPLAVRSLRRRPVLRLHQA